MVVRGDVAVATSSVSDFLATGQERALELCDAGLPNGLCERAGNGYLSPWILLTIAAIALIERRRHRSVSRIFDLYAWFLLNVVARGVTVIAMTALTVVVHEHVLGAVVFGPAETWSHGARVAAAVVLIDFLSYAVHYLQHKIPVLWEFHAVHHSQTELNVFTTTRLHFMEFVAITPGLVLPSLLLGLDVELAIAIPLVLSLVNFLSHADLRTNLGPLRYVIVTPQSHRVHHSREREHLDRNFGLTFSFWDRIFGTAWNDATEYPETGVIDPDFPHATRDGRGWVLRSYWRQQVHPFRQVAHGVKNRRNDGGFRRAFPLRG